MREDASDEPNPFDAIEIDSPIDDVEPLDDDDAASRQATTDREHLDRRHIKAILLEKKLLYRHGTYMTIIAVALLGSAGQLLWMALGRLRDHQTPRAIAYAVIAIGMIGFSPIFVRRAHADRRAAGQTAIPLPETEPDFSGLSDGKQFEANLQKMHGQEGGGERREA